MSDEKAKKGFMVAAKEFFGLLPGQSPVQFGQELKTLSYEDKMEIAAGIRKNGIDCADPMPATT